MSTKININWWLGPIVFLSFLSLPWFLSLALILVGVFGFKNFWLALPLAIISDLAYGLEGYGWWGFGFWFSLLTLLSLVVKKIANNLLIFRS